jgi:hypothetical protein
MKKMLRFLAIVILFVGVAFTLLNLSSLPGESQWKVTQEEPGVDGTKIITDTGGTDCQGRPKNCS